MIGRRRWCAAVLTASLGLPGIALGHASPHHALEVQPSNRILPPFVVDGRSRPHAITSLHRALTVDTVDPMHFARLTPGPTVGNNLTLARIVGILGAGAKTTRGLLVIAPRLTPVRGGITSGVGYSF
jgi:hypothetical protein